MTSYVRRITSNGRVTIPEKIRDSLGVEEGDLVEFKQVGDAFALRKIQVGQETLDTIRDKIRRSGIPRDEADEIVEEVRHKLRRNR